MINFRGYVLEFLYYNTLPHILIVTYTQQLASYCSSFVHPSVNIYIYELQSTSSSY